MSRGPLVQIVLVVCGLPAVLVMWDERMHKSALVWAAAWTACCWFLVPGWAVWPMLAVIATALLVTANAVRRGRRQRHAAHRVEQERQLELLLTRAEQEHLTTIETVPARLGAYANAARLLAASGLDRPLPPPPSEPRPGPEQLWRRLDDTHQIAVATRIAAVAGLARPGAVAQALRRAGVTADDLASALESELRAAPVAAALALTDDPWMRARRGAA